MSLLTGTRRALIRAVKRAWSVQFFQENDGINFGSGANIDDLFVGDCTIEFWNKFPKNVVSETYILNKRGSGGFALGWDFALDANGNVLARASFADTSISLETTVVYWDDIWHHFAIDFDVGTLTARLFVNGRLLDTSVAVGVYNSDAEVNVICNGRGSIGTDDNLMSIGWIRFSNSRRYTGTSFNPPKRNNPPANDANAQLLINMDEGMGTTATDYSGNGYNGTITFGANTRWYNDPKGL